MKIKLSIMIQLFIVFLGAVQILFSQSDTQAEIKSQLQLLYNKPFKVDCIFLDTLIGKRTSRGLGWNELINDPYNTLSGCYIFSAYPVIDDYPMNDSVVFGFFKNNLIIWSTGPTMSGNWDGLFGAVDLNAGSEVDVMTLWSYWNDQRERISYMWIFSWNGIRGNVINEIDSVNNQSKIMAIEGIFELFDGENNNKKIRAEWDTAEVKVKYFFPEVTISTLPYVTYSWNGLKYAISAEAEQVSGATFLPANNLIVSPKVVFSQGVDSNKFEYSFSNSGSSKQNVAVIYLDSKSTVTSSNQPTDWMATNRIWDMGGVYWGLIPRVPDWFNDTSINMIRPGQAENYSIFSKNLPNIVKYYIQGNTKIPYDLADQAYQNDLLVNSISGLAIGPVDPPSPFIPLNFLDTLSSYATQSHTLGWIKDSSTEIKYLTYFNTAKTKVIQNDTSTAKATLRQVLADVNADSTNNLTSEAYALLRYNTEYLIPRITLMDTLRVPSQFPTIQAAINVSDSGRVILVSAGTYNELDTLVNKQMMNLIVADSNVTIQGIKISNSTNITIKGFNISAAGTYQDGVQLTGGQNSKITIEANQIQSSTKNGINIGLNCDSINIVNNVIALNTENAINFISNATGTQFVVNNTIVKNGKCGIEAVGPQNLSIVNNIIIFDTLAGRSGERLVKGAGTTYIMQKNNLILKRQNGVIQDNYRLMPGSIAIDKGTTNFPLIPTKDKADYPRISGTTIDVGAYEYQQ